MKLGSLFDGSGGFPLAGTINGMEPVWASEIETYPIRVTEARFPNMKQLGDVTKIDGTAIEPVDVITFGSPCQDLSIAGNQAGIHEGERSSLFFEAVRIIKEMREHDRRTGRAVEHLRPRYAVWENVPGAFSSNKGADFQAVLKALCEVTDTGVSVPLPEKGKWQKAGCIVGDGYSVAWRVYDAQFWGVPQRRKRIYLIADFGSERAGEILFERESMFRDSAQSREAGEGTAENAEGSVGRSGGTWGIKGFDAYQHHNWRESETLGTLTTAGATVRGDTPLVVSYGVDCRNSALDCERTHTLQAKPNGGISLNFTPSVLYALEGNGTRDSHKGNGWKETDTMFTLNTIERHGVVYEPKSALEENWDEANVKNALRANASTSSHVVVYDTTQITSPMNYSNPKPGDPCHPLAAQQHPQLAVYPPITGALCANSHPGSYTGQDAFNGMLPVIKVDKPPRKYIVRRLTPLECCRLQGFPDWWEDGVEGSDSARYKMWGNGIALPCAVDVLGRIAKANRNEL